VKTLVFSCRLLSQHRDELLISAASDQQHSSFSFQTGNGSAVLCRVDRATLAALFRIDCSKNDSACSTQASVFRRPEYEHIIIITPLFRDLHWLRFPKRITSDLAVLAFRCQPARRFNAVVRIFRRRTSPTSRRRLEVTTAEIDIDE